MNAIKKGKREGCLSGCCVSCRETALHEHHHILGSLQSTGCLTLKKGHMIELIEA